MSQLFSYDPNLRKCPKSETRAFGTTLVRGTHPVEAVCPECKQQGQVFQGRNNQPNRYDFPNHNRPGETRPRFNQSGTGFHQLATLSQGQKVMFVGSAQGSGVAPGIIERVQLTDDDGVIYWVRWDAPYNGSDGMGQVVGAMPYPRKDLRPIP